MLSASNELLAESKYVKRGEATVEEQGVRQNNIYSDILIYIKRVLLLIMIVSFAAEMLLFPSIDNFMGCVMMATSLLVAQAYFKNSIIVQHPFSFFMYIVVFLYRFLPTPCTLLELKPVSYGMEMASETFVLETITFIVITFAFHESIRHKIKRGKLESILKQIGVYGSTNIRTLWIFGIFGAVAKVAYLFIFGVGKTGSTMATSARVLNAFEIFEYAPIILFFPCLYNGKGDVSFRKKSVWVYTAIMCVINLANNSRGGIVQYVVAILFFWFIAIIKTGVKVKTLLNPRKMLILIAAMFVFVNLLTTMSNAMLAIRSSRGEYKASELIKVTIQNMFDSEEVNNLLTKKKQDTSKSYHNGWTEDYVDNFILNRFCNIRITDETLYYGSMLTESDRELMRSNFGDKLLSLVPSTVLRVFKAEFDKTSASFSRGDYIYYLSGYGSTYSLGGQRVTSNLGDGLATWGVFYFLLEFVASYLIMKVSDIFVYRNQAGDCTYSLMGLLLLWSFTQIFCNNSGLLSIFNFLLRGFWETLIVYTLLYFGSSLFVKRGGV